MIYEIWLQPTSRRFLRELDKAPGGNNLHYILQCLRVPTSVTRVWTRKVHWVATKRSQNDGSKTQYYIVILDRLQGRSGALEQAPESQIRGPLTVWGIHKIPKSAHLSHGLPLPTTDISISLANSSRRWRASGVSYGRYWTRCLLVRGRRSIRFISSLEERDKGGRKAFIQFLCCCCSTAATQSASKRWAKSLWRSSSLYLVSSSSCFFCTSSSSLFCSAIFASL